VTGPDERDQRLRALLRSLPAAPGVYRMLDARDQVLYVGKARDLKKRVASYFKGRDSAPKTRAMVAQIDDIEVTVTRTEGEALLLENNLIKQLRPRYNILLRDDKSYPYIFLSSEHEFPRLAFHRGAKREKGRYFGPFPSAGAVRETLALLQKVFPVRQCEDGFFRNRSRPCLQYQIKRCTAPCVGYIAADEYREDVRQAELFLEGKSQALVDELAARMQQAADAREFERAAVYRDRIASLRRVQERQYVDAELGEADVVAVQAAHGKACVTALYFRGGRQVGAKSFFPAVSLESSEAQILSAFLAQHYLGRTIPPEILLDRRIEDRDAIEDAFSAQRGARTAIVERPRGGRRRWVEMASVNAADALRRNLSGSASMMQRFEALQQALGLPAQPERLECMDISHTMGEAAVASCVVFDRGGQVKEDYRRYNIAGITPGDDYAALAQAVARRYRRFKDGEGKMPDLLLIDGGKGQLAAVDAVLNELQVEGVMTIGVAKGRERKPGNEQLFLSGSRRATILPADSPALHLIQQVRDEAHRFAIAGHRGRRSKARRRSRLEDIPGVGEKRRQALLKNLGGWQEIERAGVEDLSRVPGISPKLAQRIYDVFHGG
jgi:excinuclease ABC subunit C